MKNLLKFIFGFTVVLFILIVHDYLTTGEVSLTRKGMNFRVMEKDWRANEARRQAIGYKPESMQEVVKSTARNYPGNLWKESKMLVKYTGWPVVMLAVIGIATKPIFICVGLLQFFIYPLFTGLGFVERFVLPYIPIMIILAVIVLSKVNLTFSITGLIVCFLAVLPAWDITKLDCDPAPDLRAIGEYLNRKLPRDAILLDRKPWVSLYAGLRSDQYKNTPVGSIDAVIDHGQKIATHLIVSRRISAIFRPALLPLFEPKIRKSYEKRIKLLYIFYEKTPYETLVFQFIQ